MKHYVGGTAILLLTFTSIPQVDTFIENPYVTLKCDLLNTSAQYKLSIYQKKITSGRC